MFLLHFVNKNIGNLKIYIPLREILCRVNIEKIDLWWGREEE